MRAHARAFVLGGYPTLEQVQESGVLGDSERLAELGVKTKKHLKKLEKLRKAQKKKKKKKKKAAKGEL